MRLGGAAGWLAPNMDNASPPGSLAALRGKSLLIFDDSMLRVDGHPYEYARAVAEMHIALGVRVTIICHRSFEMRGDLERMGVEVLPIIEKSMWSGDYGGGGRIREPLIMLRQNLSFRKLLGRHLKGRRYDLIFAPNAILFDALAWCLLRKSGGLRKVGRLVLLLRFHVGIYLGAPRISFKKRLWGVMLRCQRRAVAQCKTAIVVDSSHLARDYHAVSGIEPAVVPSPRIMKGPADTPNFARSGTVVFGSLGGARYDKGTDVFQEAIKGLIESGRAGSMAFLIQWHQPMTRPDGTVCHRDPVLTASGQVRFLDRPLRSDEYDALFPGIDCMVLPYRRELYGSSISGVCVEAACAGVPVICTDRTWLSDFMADQGAGIAVPSVDPDQLADAMAAMADAIERYSADARRASTRAREQNSPERFMRILWGLGASTAEAGSAV